MLEFLKNILLFQFIQAGFEAGFESFASHAHAGGSALLRLQLGWKAFKLIDDGPGIAVRCLHEGGKNGATLQGQHALLIRRTQGGQRKF